MWLKNCTHTVPCHRTKWIQDRRWRFDLIVCDSIEMQQKKKNVKRKKKIQIVIELMVYRQELHREMNEKQNENLLTFDSQDFREYFFQKWSMMKFVSWKKKNWMKKEWEMGILHLRHAQRLMQKSRNYSLSKPKSFNFSDLIFFSVLFFLSFLVQSFVRFFFTFLEF